MDSPREAPAGRARSIGWVVSLTLVGVITLLLGIAGTIAFASYRASRWEDLRQKHGVLSDQLAVGLASPLWNFDRPTLTKIAEGAFEDPVITGLLIRAADDGSIIHARERREGSGSAVVEGEPAGPSPLTETRPILFNGEAIGTLRVMATDLFVERDLRTTLGRVILSIFGLDLAVILGLYVLLRRFVLHPLEDIERHALAISSGHRGEPARLERSAPMELVSLHASIVRMVDQLDARFDALEKGKEELKKAYGDLSHANSELSRSNSELQEYAYVASHDLQEPLRAVAGCVQLLQQRFQGRLDAKGDELIGHAVEGSLRMQTLIDDLLTLSRVGTHAGAPVLTDFTAIYEGALANLSAARRESGAVVTHDPFPSLLVEPTQMVQLLQNLLSNALKYRAERPPAIHLGVRRLEREWQFEVRDNGIGIEAQYFERIFRLFQRLHTRREYPGTGIGLAVCKKIVERHGGRIWVESEVGRGSSFFFTLSDKGSTS